MRHLTKDEKGVVSIEFAMILVLFVVPVAIAVAQYAPSAVRWISQTSKHMEQNTLAQQRTQVLLEKLLNEQHEEASDGNTTAPDPTTGCDPTPGATERPC